MVFKENNPSVFEFEKQGASIEGNLLNIEKDVGVHKSKMYSIGTQTGVKKIWGSKVLDDNMRGIKIGETVRITFLGLGPAKKGNPPKLFQVLVDRDEEESQEHSQDQGKEEQIAEADPEYEVPVAPKKPAEPVKKPKTQKSQEKLLEQPL